MALETKNMSFIQLHALGVFPLNMDRSKKVKTTLEDSYFQFQDFYDLIISIVVLV